MGQRVSNGATMVDRKSERDLVVTRRFEAPVRLVYDAWTKADLFQLWWAPKSSGANLLSCEMDVRTGGGYRLVFGHGDQSMAFFGKYLDVVPLSRMVWTNDESAEAAVTTVTFEAQDGGTRVVLHEAYPSKEALDEAFIGMEDAMPEQFRQLDELLATLSAEA